MWEYICISRYALIYRSSALISYDVMLLCLSLISSVLSMWCCFSLTQDLIWWYLLFFKYNCMVDIAQLFYLTISYIHKLWWICGYGYAVENILSAVLALSAVTMTADMTLWLYGAHYSIQSALGYQYALPQIRSTVCDNTDIILCCSDWHTYITVDWQNRLTGTILT